MTAEEAMRIRKSPTADDVEWNELHECIDNALEKQIPKKPIISEEQLVRYMTTFECPACNGKFNGFGVAKYCYHCGQAIDWSEIDTL